MIYDVRNGNFPFLLVFSEKMAGFSLGSSSNTIGNLKIFGSEDHILPNKSCSNRNQYC